MTESDTAAGRLMITDPASIKKYNRGPITKPYEPASSCAATLSFDGNMYYGWAFAGIVDTACYPMGTLDNSQIEPASAWDLFYYSPAVCPGGWGSITTFTSGVPNGNGSTSISLGSDTTAVLCCPSGYVYLGDSGHICSSPISEGQSLTYVTRVVTDQGGLLFGGTALSIYPSASYAFANGVIVLRQSSDISIINPTTTTASTTTTSPSSDRSSASTPSNTSSPPPDTADTSSGGLSTGAKIGIGVSIPLIALLGLAFGFFLFRRKRVASAAPPAPDYDKADMIQYVHAEPKHEMHAEPIHEAHTEPAEIGGNDDARGSSAGEQEHQRHELQ